MDQKILVVSSNEILGYEDIEYLGVVQGSTVKSRNFISDLIASLKTIIGGELVYEKGRFVNVDRMERFSQ